MGKAAEGIPDRENYGDVTKIPLRTLLTYVDQLHEARRAGPHHDIRFGDRELFSWAGRKGLPGPGERTALFQQPLHSKAYADFQGEISSGYGAGRVTTHDKGTAFVTETSPDKIKFVLAHKKYPEYYTMIRTKGKNRPWLIVNHTPEDPTKITGSTETFKKKHLGIIPAARVDEVLNGVVEGKIDGASGLFKLKEDSIDVMSFRVGSGGKPIIHTERFFGKTPNKFNIPPEFRNRVARGEIYGVDALGKPLGGQGTSPLLNMTLENSLKAQESRGIGLRAALFGFGDKPLNYPEREEELGKLLEALPPEKFGRPPVAHGGEEARKLWNEIAAGKHPETDEGIVAYPEKGNPVKVKLRPEYDVEISGVFPGEGKYRGSAGGIEYRGGGRVGTGFDDAYRKWLWDNREAVRGRIARITSTKKLPSGKYYQPSFLNMHEDYPTKQAEENNTPIDYLKNTAITAGAHRLGDSALTYGVRRGGLFQNYYANVAKEGINAALTGKDVMPQWRRALGIISPSLTGLTDYEVSRGLTHKLLHDLKNQGITQNPKDLKELLKQHPEALKHLQALKKVKNLSPIARNIMNAADSTLPKNRFVEFLKTYGGVGKDRQKNPAVLGAALAGLTGAPHGVAGAAGAMLSTAPDLTFGAMGQNKNLIKNLEEMKLGIIGAGTLTQADTPLKSKFISGGLNAISPSSGEIYDLGQDLAQPLSNLQSKHKNLAKKFIKEKIIAPGKTAPFQALKNVGKIFKLGSAFTPDYTPEDLRGMGVFDEVYARTKPRLASLNTWPAHWFHPEDKMGWLEWYEKYSGGRRMEDDERQIGRWKAFKARHGGRAFQENPTPRRAYALRNWGIDPVKLLNDEEKRVKLMESMKAYRDKKYEKVAGDWLSYLNKLGENQVKPPKKEKEHPIARALFANIAAQTALPPVGLLAAGLSMRMPGTGGEELTKQHLEELLDNSKIPSQQRPKINWKGVASYNSAAGDSKLLKTLFTNAMYDPRDNSIGATGYGRLTPGVLAHELGHAQIQHGTSRLARGTQNIGRGLSQALGPLASLFATQKAVNANDSNLEGAGKGAIAGAVGGAPLLLNELDASRRGIAMLLRSKLSLKHKLMNSLSMAPALGLYGASVTGVPALFGALTARAKRRVKEKNQKNEEAQNAEANTKTAAPDMEWSRAGGGIPEAASAFDALRNQIPKMQTAAYNFGGKAYDFLANLNKNKTVVPQVKPVVAGGQIR